MPSVRPLAKAAMTTLGGGASATVATYRLALPMKLNIMLPKNSANSAVVTYGQVSRRKSLTFLWHPLQAQRGLGAKSDPPLGVWQESDRGDARCGCYRSFSC